MSFYTHNFDADEGWKEYLQKVSVVSGDSDIIEKLKKRYYKRDVNPSWEESKDPLAARASPAQPSPRAASQTSRTTQPPSGVDTRSSASTNRAAPSPFSDGYLSLKSVWFLANVSILIHCAIFIVPFIGHSVSIYRRALLSSIVTYAIVLYTSLGGRMPGWSLQAWAPFLMNENVHYLLLCATFLNTPVPVTLVLLPLAIYAFYHVLDNGSAFLRRVPPLQPYVTRVKALQPKAMLVVAYTEILTMPMLIILTLTGGAGILSIIMHFQFLQFRYIASSTARTVWAMLGAVTDRWAAHPRVPQLARAAYAGAKRLLARLVQQP